MKRAERVETQDLNVISSRPLTLSKIDGAYFDFLMFLKHIPTKLTKIKQNCFCGFKIIY